MGQQQTFPFLKKTAHAVLSEDRVFRYVLYRSLDGEDWDAVVTEAGVSRTTICFVMLNPSTADEHVNDATIDKIEKFGRAWGYSRLAVVNLFAIRETDSKKLKHMARVRDIVGPDNDRYLDEVVSRAWRVVCAWGTEGQIGNRGAEVTTRLKGVANLWCFKLTLLGDPYHPLYQPDSAQLIPFAVSP